MAAAQRELERSQRVALTAASFELKRSVEQRLPASKRLRGVGKKGARIGVRYDIETDGRAVVKAIGPLHLLERDTKAHEIKPKSSGRGSNRKQRKGAVRLANGEFRASVQHPGTKGQHPFEKGIEDGTPKAVKLMRNATSDAVKRGLKSG